MTSLDPDIASLVAPFEVIPLNMALTAPMRTKARAALRYANTVAGYSLYISDEDRFAPFASFSDPNPTMIREDPDRPGQCLTAGATLELETNGLRSLAIIMPNGDHIKFTHRATVATRNLPIDLRANNEAATRTAFIRYLTVLANHLEAVYTAGDLAQHTARLAELQNRAWAISASVMLNPEGRTSPLASTLITSLETPWSKLDCSFLLMTSTGDLLTPAEQAAWAYPPAATATVSGDTDNLIISFEPITARVQSDKLGDAVSLMRSLSQLPEPSMMMLAA